MVNIEIVFLDSQGNIVYNDEPVAEEEEETGEEGEEREENLSPTILSVVFKKEFSFPEKENIKFVYDDEYREWVALLYDKQWNVLDAMCIPNDACWEFIELFKGVKKDVP